MAIQISEKGLSPEAKRALNNAKNKSQFMRDAIEYYVKSGNIQDTVEISCDSEIKEDIKEIKEILKNLSINRSALESVTSLDSSLNEIENNNDEETIISSSIGEGGNEEIIETDDELDDVEIPDCYDM